jgi:undecaprenyl-diphosphatase
MTIFHSLILGLVEGLTEFLPISSTAHLILASRLLHIVSTDFSKSFDIVIQLGAILAVVVLYFKKLFNWLNIKKLFVAFVPTAVIGLAFYGIVKNYLLDSLTTVVWALLIGGALLIVFEYLYKPKTEGIDGLENITYTQCLLIGLFQSFSIVPGVSRAAATIVGGLILGLSRRTIVEFSFLLAVPTMLAASGLDLIKSGASFSNNEYGLLLVGFVTAFLVALGVIKLLIGYVQKYNFKPFGVYRIIIGLLFLWFIL